MSIQRLATLILGIGLLAMGSPALMAQALPTAPRSVIHIVTVKFKEGTTPAQIQAALDGVQAMTKSYKGLTRVWTKTYSAQGDKTHVFAMEFTDEAAFKAYTGSDAQKKWYELYLPIREESTTFDVTN